jgi:acyl-CoA synthetase (AMP-forming)/AMP-acid ligase II
MNVEPRTLVELLHVRAQSQPDKLAYTFLVDGEREGARLTYAELDRSARAIAATLQSNHVQPGERALLLYPPGLDFICAFFGCLYAGVVAVPSFPPHPAQLARTLPRLVGVATDAELSAVLSTAAMVAESEIIARRAPILGTTPWIATDALVEHTGASWRAPMLAPDMLAFLQYTSGSTSAPKGVMVSHANLLHNLAYANHVEENDSASVSVSWLPVIHDMGLIEGVLEPMYAGYPAYLMAPAAFLQRPIRWLRAISRYRATNSGGPNFAYDLCARKITDAQCNELDLSSWSVAYNGAEPIRGDTLSTFYERFRNVGFRWRSFYPVYGLAEATLLVSSGRRDYEAEILDADAGAISRGELCAATDETPITRPLVACGTANFGTRVAIVDPETRQSCAEGEIGEIWVASASVAHGYWRREQLTAETFRASLASGEGPFLRTGDLGVLRNGELIVTGRLKDLLIVRGLKHYPQDLELTAERQHSALRAGCAAAFAVEDEDEIAVAIEVDPRALLADVDERAGQLQDIIAAIRRAVTEEHGIVLGAVSLLSIGTMPKTSSGKLRRHACRQGFIEHTLDEMMRWPEQSQLANRDEVLEESAA